MSATSSPAAQLKHEEKAAQARPEALKDSQLPAQLRAQPTPESVQHQNEQLYSELFAARAQTKKVKKSKLRAIFKSLRFWKKASSKKKVRGRSRRLFSEIWAA